MTPALRSLARRQHGVFTRQQALRAGMSARELDRSLLTGDCVALTERVLVAASTPLTHPARCWAASLQLGPPCALARRSAAWFLRLDRSPEVDGLLADIAVPRPRRADDLDGVADVRRIVPRALTTTTAAGLVVTAPDLTLRELAFVLPRDWIRDMIQHAIRRRRVTFTGLARQLGRGLPGAATLRDVLNEIAPGFDVVFEGTLWDALRREGVPVEPQVRVALLGGGSAVLDLAVEECRFGVEVDGLANHLDRFARDRRRDRLLTLSGWVILRVAVSEITADLPAVVAEIAAAYRLRTTALAHELGAGIRTR